MGVEPTSNSAPSKVPLAPSPLPFEADEVSVSNIEYTILLDSAMVRKYYRYMANARTAILITIDLAHEGGFQNNPKDRANWTGGQVGVGRLVGTKYGITTLDMPGVDIANLTPAQAVDYYTEHYWKLLYSQINSQQIANKLFDLGVLFGVGTAIKELQDALGFTTAEVDGAFGPATLSAVNQADPDTLLAAFQSEMVARATAIAESNSNDAPDLPDWKRRINS